ncbi:DUF4012 domain-containing protein [Streptomyces formicae]|uniref:DUF4012 domain-containing protein n=1 Tax=Streptomyces formicae TaxID=1616117 RepID=A0ABY3WNL2_9ACTN|nr:DUF4012 domain-containing protein [Streptomyces formicae]UNM14223.1 DUF4012 domain-containing protein [Streptomyces formicae]
MRTRALCSTTEKEPKTWWRPALAALGGTGGTGGTGGKGVPRVPGGPDLRRRVVHVLCGVALLCLAGAGWIAVTSVFARAELMAAQRSLETLRQSVAGAPGSPGSPGSPGRPGPPGAPKQQAPAAALDSAAEHAAKAHRLTTGPAWYLAAQLPVLGRPVGTVRQLADTAARLTHEVLPAPVRVAGRRAEGTAGESLPEVLSRLGATAPELERAAAAAADMRAGMHELPRTSWLPAADRARSEVARQLDRIAPAMADAAVAARVLPSMLGADEPRRYFVVFQNTAEARGTGGLPGAFAVLTVEQGELGFETFGTDTILAEVEPSIDPGAEFTARYGGMDPVNTWANSNVSPHFPNAARIWAATWHAYSGERVDGAIALDPSALARLLRATGPGRMPDGTQVTADNALDLAERTGYARYPDSAQRKAFLLDVARSAADRLVSALAEPRYLPGLMMATYDIVNEDRLKLWSARSDEQTRLETHRMSGTLPASPGPFAGVVVNNAAGGKLDYYLDRELHWIPGRCTSDGVRSVTARITLTNRAPVSGLPAYVTQRGDKPRHPTRPGDNRLLVSYFASRDALLDEVTVDGRPAMVNGGYERGHPVYTLDVELPAQSSRTLTLKLREPAGDRPPVLLRQALVTPLRTRVEPYPPCGD